MMKIKLPGKKVLGFYVLTIGVLSFFKVLFYEMLSIGYVMAVLLLIMAVDMVVRSLVVKGQKDRKLFIPGATLLQGILFFFLYYLIFAKIGLTFEKLWPVLGVFPGLSLILHYLIFQRKSPTVVVPGIFITLLSIVILLINLDIFKIGFKHFLMLLIPLFAIILGLFLILGKESDDDKSEDIGQE